MDDQTSTTADTLELLHLNQVAIIALDVYTLRDEYIGHGSS